jgi:hypothetical protein
MPDMVQKWPDVLSQPTSHAVSDMLEDFWLRLVDLPDLLARKEDLLIAERIAELRTTVVDLVLAANGVARPNTTRNLNTYLSSDQRRALEKTLVMAEANTEAWIGQAVALIVIYRWYAPQLVEKYQVPYPDAAELDALHRLSVTLPQWPRSITTE